MADGGAGAAGAAKSTSLAQEVALAAAAASEAPGLRHPPWLQDERARTLFRDVDLLEMRRARDDGWRKAHQLKEKELPPIVMHKTATGMVILREGTTGAPSVAELLAAKVAAEAGTPARVRFGDASADGGRPKAIEKETSAAAKMMKGKRIVRFKYTFRAPPWTLPRGVKRPVNQAAAHEAGVRSIGRVRLPVAPSHHRYIESLEDEVTALATECDLRRKMLLAKIERFTSFMWRPPGSTGSAPGGTSLVHSLSSVLQQGAGGGGGGGGGGGDGDAAGDGDDDDDDASSHGSGKKPEHDDADLDVPL